MTLRAQSSDPQGRMHERAAPRASAESVARAYRAEPTLLRAHTTVRHGFRTIMCEDIRHLVKNRRAALKGGGMECVHQMRVALRRLDATVGLFRDVISAPETQRIKTDMQWLSSRLGAARDWDVFETRTLQTIQQDTANRAVAERIARAGNGPRRAADLRARRAITSDRYRDFIHTTKVCLANGQWCVPLDPAALALLDEPLKQAGRPWLRRSARKVRHIGKNIRHLRAKRRHRLRIALKQLRYETNAVCSLYPARKVKPYVQALSGLQDVLGDLNDLAVARELLHEMKNDGCSIDRELGVKTRRRLKDLKAAWKLFRDVPAFWK